MSFFDQNSLESLLAQVIKTHHQRTHLLLGKLGLYPGQPAILFMLWEKDGRTQKELANKLGLKPATISIMVKRMEKAGLVERQEDREDLRISRIYVTEQGKKIRLEVETVVKELNDQCFNGFTMEEKLLLRRFLLQMLDNLMEN